MSASFPDAESWEPRRIFCSADPNSSEPLHCREPLHLMVSDGLEKLFGVVLRGDDLLATVVTGRADVMTTMHFTGRRFNSGRRIGQKVVSTMIAALGDRLLILLNSHFYTPRGKT